MTRTTPNPSPADASAHRVAGRSGPVRRERGIVLAIVLVLIFALITAVYAFQRRALIDTTIAQNRLAAAEADALARGGIRIAEAIVYLSKLKAAAAEGESEGGAAGAGGPASGLGQALLPQGLFPPPSGP